ncbi:MAG: DUF4258 domain-containing protein [Anaerolineae bacterium]|nr:DUF4258 domain-containing protein [Anaerolineae bacterium]
MYVTDTESLLAYSEALRVSKHALYEACKEGLRGKDIVHAIFNGEIIEHYPDRKRVLILGPTLTNITFDDSPEPTKVQLPLHVVCDYSDNDVVVAVTVYIPNRERWVVNWKTRRFN